MSAQHHVPDMKFHFLFTWKCVIGHRNMEGFKTHQDVEKQSAAWLPWFTIAEENYVWTLEQH